MGRWQRSFARRYRRINGTPISSVVHVQRPRRDVHEITHHQRRRGFGRFFGWLGQLIHPSGAR